MKISFEQFGLDTKTLTNKITDHIAKQEFELVIVSRGGLFVGGLLSYLLGIKKSHLVCLESYEQDISNGNVEVSEVIPFNYNSLRDKKILVVDDINDSGETASYLRNKLEPIVKRVLFASVYQKPKSNSPSDFVGLVLDGNEWIEFPWDNLDKNLNIQSRV